MEALDFRLCQGTLEDAQLVDQPCQADGVRLLLLPDQGSKNCLDTSHFVPIICENGG